MTTAATRPAPAGPAPGAPPAPAAATPHPGLLEPLRDLPGLAQALALDADAPERRVIAEIGADEGTAPTVLTWGRRAAAVAADRALALDDLIVTTDAAYHLLRRAGSTWIYLRVRRADGNLALARRRLAAVTGARAHPAPAASSTPARPVELPAGRSSTTPTPASSTAPSPAGRWNTRPDRRPTDASTAPSTTPATSAPAASPSRAPAALPAPSAPAAAAPSAPAPAPSAPAPSAPAPSAPAPSAPSAPSAPAAAPSAPAAAPSAPAAAPSVPAALFAPATAPSTPAPPAAVALPTPRRPPGASLPAAARNPAPAATEGDRGPSPPRDSAGVLGQRWRTDPETLRRVLAGLLRLGRAPQAALAGTTPEPTTRSPGATPTRRNP